MMSAIFRRWLNLPVTLCTYAKGGRNITPSRCGARFYDIVRQAVRMSSTMYPPPPPLERGPK